MQLKLYQTPISTVILNVHNGPSELDGGKVPAKGDDI
jgi:hypothetical protein